MVETALRPISIKYGDNETGWAEPLEEPCVGSLARISNVPFFTDDLNLEDTVRLCKDGSGSRDFAVGEVVSKGFEQVTSVFYDEEWQFWRMDALFRMMGARVEGISSPKEGTPGLLVVAHQSEIDPRLAAKALGLGRGRPKA